MANVKILFFGSKKGGTNENALDILLTDKNELLIRITQEDYPKGYIALDKSTAIRFSKELRRQIALLKSEED